MRFRPSLALVAVAVLAGAGLAACSNDGRTLAPAKPDQTASIVTTSTLDPNATFQLATPFGETTPIQEQYTCEGTDTSPPLSWVAVPEGTAELALVVTDDDADGFIHWVVAGMDPTIVTEIQEGAPPPSAVEGLNDFGTLGWRGPCPPGGETHHYTFTLYSLAEPVSIESGMSGKDALDIIQGASTESASVTSVFP